MSSSTVQNGLRRLLHSGQTATGCFATLPDPLAAETLARAGYDVVVVDLQHGVSTGDMAASVVQGVMLGGAVPLIRVEWISPPDIMKALDIGAAGVIIPMVDDAASARAAADAMRYPPEGTRSFGPVRRIHADPAEANADVLCLPMIETAAGLDNVDEIVSTPGVDGLFVGPADLGLALGIGLDMTMRNPAVHKAVDRIVDAAERHGKFVGTVASDAAHAADLYSRGVRFVTLGSDKSFLSAGASAAVVALKKDQSPQVIAPPGNPYA